jgi:hypothetical protein
MGLAWRYVMHAEQVSGTRNAFNSWMIARYKITSCFIYLGLGYLLDEDQIRPAKWFSKSLLMFVEGGDKYDWSSDDLVLIKIYLTNPAYHDMELDKFFNSVGHTVLTHNGKLLGRSHDLQG